MTIKKIRRGLVYAQNDEGALVNFMALTKQASYAIEGDTLLNKVFLAAGHALWSMKLAYAPVVRITGVVSGCVVSPHASADKVQSSAGVANVNGTQVAVSADTDISLTRPANAKVCVSAITVNAAGSVTATKGTDGDAYDLTGGYGGAGQKPLVAVTEAVLAYVCTSEDEAAVVPASDIFVGDNANVSYRIDHLRGGIILNEALDANRTGAIPRSIYAQFYELTNSLLAIGTIEEATLTIKEGAPIATNNMDSVWDTYVKPGTLGWSLSVKRWRPDQYWIDKMLDPTQDNFLVKVYEDASDSFYYIGYGMKTGDMNLSIKRGPVSETLNFTGNGELRRV